MKWGVRNKTGNFQLLYIYKCIEFFRLFKLVVWLLNESKHIVIHFKMEFYVCFRSKIVSVT